MVLDIKVKTLDSQNYEFQADDSWTVLQFKEHIHDTVNIPPEEQRLIFCGRVLQNDRNLVDCDCNGQVIHLVRRPPPTQDTPNSSSSNSDTNNNTNSNGQPNPSIRHQGEGNILFSAMAMGPDTNISSVLRHITTLQREMLIRLTGVSQPLPNRVSASSNNVQQNNGAGAQSNIENSVTIRVETNPPASNEPAGTGQSASATFVLSPEPTEAEIQIPISIPISIPMNPQGLTFGIPINMQTPLNSAEEARQAPSDTARSTGSDSSPYTIGSLQPQTNQPFSVISSRIPAPAPYECYLTCFVPMSHHAAATRPIIRMANNARVHVRNLSQQGSANQASGSTTSSAPAPPRTQASQTQMNLDPALTEVMTNIMNSIFRPTQPSPPSQTNQNAQGNPLNPNQSNFLDMLPELAVNAASQVLGNAFGIPFNQTNATSRQASSAGQRGHQDELPRTQMMDMEVDEVVDGQSGVEFHDACENQTSLSSSNNQQLRENPVAGTSSQMDPPKKEPKELDEAIRNHPDWIATIIADLEIMNQTESNRNDLVVLSDAYLSSTRKRRK